MEFPLFIVDAFTLNDQPFTGNAAAVCILNSDEEISDEIKQKIASEMNISETAFVAKTWNKSSEIESNRYTLRWFTPKNEVDLCGHATLATSRVIFDRYTQNNKIIFDTKFKGILEAINNPKQKTITLDFPLNPCKLMDRKTNPWVHQIVKYTLGPELSTDLIEDIQYSTGTKKLLLRLKEVPESEKIIYKIKPNFEELLKIDTNCLVRGVIVTQRCQRVHFLSRYFAPWVGINEDPVTGSAHTVLASYWKGQYEQDGPKIDVLIGEQCSKRGGTVVCNILENNVRVRLSGKTRTVVSGFITI